MALSNYLPSSRINQPGVCTSTTRPVSPYEGQVIYETDTDRVLVWNNSAWVDPSTGKAERSGLVKIVPSGATNGTVGANGDVTIGSAVSSITITGCFTSEFDNYLITLIGGLTSNSNIDLRMTLRTSNGSTSTTGYYAALIYSTMDSATPLAYNISNGGYWANSACSNGTKPNMYANVLNPNIADYTFITNSFIRSNAVGTHQGWHTVSTAYNSFVLTCSSGTITGGTIRVYGYNQ